MIPSSLIYSTTLLLRRIVLDLKDLSPLGQLILQY